MVKLFFSYELDHAGHWASTAKHPVRIIDRLNPSAEAGFTFFSWTGENYAVLFIRTDAYLIGPPNVVNDTKLEETP